MIVLCIQCGANITHADDCDCRTRPRVSEHVSQLQRVVQLAAALAPDGRPTRHYFVQAAEALRGEPS